MTKARREKTTRKELQLLIAKAMDLFIVGCPPRRIAPQVNRSVTTVKRWMEKAKITPPTTQTQELWEASLIKAEAYAIHQKAPDIEAVALRLETPAHIVRAAIYLARQEAGNEAVQQDGGGPGE